MPDGTVVSGKAMAVEPDALVVKIHESTDRAVYPKGQLRVPRSTLKMLELRTKSKHFRVIGTVLGAAGGLVCGAVAGLAASGGILSNDHDTRAAAVFLGISAGGTTAGYLVGNALDQRSTAILIEQ